MTRRTSFALAQLLERHPVGSVWSDKIADALARGYEGHARSLYRDALQLSPPEEPEPAPADDDDEAVELGEVDLILCEYLDEAPPPPARLVTGWQVDWSIHGGEFLPLTAPDTLRPMLFATRAQAEEAARRVAAQPGYAARVVAVGVETAD